MNEGLGAQNFRNIASEILDRNLKTNWYASARLEPGFGDNGLLHSLKKSGCRRIYFGLEGGSQKVLDAMKKGITTTDAKKSWLHAQVLV